MQAAIATCDPAKILMLAVVDVAAGCSRRIRSFMKGGFSPQAPGEFALLTWNGDSLELLAPGDLPAEAKLGISPAALQGRFHSHQTLQVGGLIESRTGGEADTFQPFGDSTSACIQHMLSMQAALFPFLFPTGQALYTLSACTARSSACTAE